MGGPKKPKEMLSSSSAWREESEVLGAILLGCGLVEEVKWGQRCYTFEGKNIAIVQKMKAFLALMFFKGALLKDSEGLLAKPGANSNVARRFEFAADREIVESRSVIERYVREAIEIEKAGRRVSKPAALVLSDELKVRFARDPGFKAAFEALTPGRQRGYNIYFSAPKGAEARERRIDKYVPKILAGRGFHDR